MIELLYTSLVIFGFYFIFFFISITFHPIKISMYVFQLILCFILFSNHFYKKHPLWKDNEYNPIHELPYSPITDIDSTLKVTLMQNITYSIEKTEEFSNECLENFFIRSDQDCPITEIIFENKKNENYKDYIEIELNDTKYSSYNNSYIYYTNKNKKGKLYGNELDKNYLNINETSFNYETANNIKSKEEFKLSNPFTDLKNYVKYYDFICLGLFVFLLIYIFTESLDDYKCSIFKIINVIIHAALFLLYLFRFLKFIEVKKFLFNNKNLYSNDYLPHKYFNIDSFPIAVEINIFLYYILYMLFRNKPSGCSNRERDDYKKYMCLNCDCCCEVDTIIISILLIIPVLLTLIMFSVFDIINDFEIKKIYDNMIYNWETYPIKSISLSAKESYSFGKIRTNKTIRYTFYNWKNNYFKVERLNHYDYLNIYNNENGKICGKDSYGNNLFFPEDIECPINDIFFSNYNMDLTNYTKLNLAYNEFLYYTNKKTDGEILIDIKASSSKGLQLNLDKTNEICEYYISAHSKLFGVEEDCSKFYKFSTIPFYKTIDNWIFSSFINSEYSNNNDYIYLYSIHYLGIESDLNDKKNNIQNFKKNMDIYIIFAFFKLSCFILISIFYICEIFIIFLKFQPWAIFIIIIFFVIVIYYLTISVISLFININFIQKIMNKINKDFQRKKTDIFWNIIIIIYASILTIGYLIMIILSLYKNKIGCLFRERNNEQNNINNNINNQDNINNNINNNPNNNINNNPDINLPNINNNPPQENNPFANRPIIDINDIHINIRNDVPNIRIQNNNKENNIINNDNNKIKSKNKNNIKLHNSFDDKIGGNPLFKEFDIINTEEEKLKKDKDKYKNLCTICREEPSKVILVPCKHRCICNNCYKNKKNLITQCPICRKKPQYFIDKIFDS